MKKFTLLVTALTLVSGSAFASKARMASLGNSAHLTTDTQSIFDNIARITQIGDFATYEFGITSTRSLGANTLDSDFNALSGAAIYEENALGGQRIYAPNSEGGFVMSSGDHKFGAYIGRKSQFTTLARSVGGFLGQDNGVEVMYGSKAAPIAWGASFNYSASDKKSASQKQNAMGIRLGLVAANWDAYALIGLGSSADGASKAGGALNDTDAKYRGTTGYKIGGGYWLNTMYFHGNMYQDGAKIDYSAASPIVATYATNYIKTKMNVEQRHIEVGVVDTIKTDNSMFFYGVSYNIDSADNKEESDNTLDPYKLDKTSMPFIIGVEAEANSWLTVRASVKQNILLGEKKAQGAEANSIDNSTVANAGVGLKWNKISLDATIAKSFTAPAAAGTGNVTADNFFGNTSVTYMF